jgi:D-glycero-D-manno-heptose 1,7-bisphosphate phosphatase
MGIDKKIIYRAVFFDRDGILIKAPVKNGYPKATKTIGKIKIIPGIKKICKSLKKKFKLIMITNQPDVAKKKNTKKNVIIINDYLKSYLGLDSVYVCYSNNERNKDRKPNPGMILKAKKKYNLNLKRCYVVGDRWKDIDAGNIADCKTIFIDYKYKEKLRSKPNFTTNKVVNIMQYIK